MSADHRFCTICGSPQLVEDQADRPLPESPLPAELAKFGTR
jgi:hypothetical protein